MSKFNLSNYKGSECLVQSVASNILEDMLEYEGGAMQSMREAISCTVHNNKIIAYAEDKGINIVIDHKALGRSIEKI